MMMIVGRMPGIVTCSVCFQRPAPSIFAASYSCMSSPDSAERKMIVSQPTLCQILDPIYIGRKYWASLRKLIFSMPMEAMI